MCLSSISPCKRNLAAKIVGVVPRRANRWATLGSEEELLTPRTGRISNSPYAAPRLSNGPGSSRCTDPRASRGLAAPTSRPYSIASKTTSPSKRVFVTRMSAIRSARFSSTRSNGFRSRTIMSAFLPTSIEPVMSACTGLVLSGCSARACATESSTLRVGVCKSPGHNDDGIQERHRIPKDSRQDIHYRSFGYPCYPSGEMEPTRWA